jgi:hypothetical protein
MAIAPARAEIAVTPPEGVLDRSMLILQYATAAVAAVAAVLMAVIH